MIIPNRLVLFLDPDEYRMDYDRQIDTSRCKRTVGTQYKHESKEDIAGFISKPEARPEYGTIYQHKDMLLSWPENQGILFFIYISQIFPMNWISLMVAQVNAVLLIHWFYMGDQVRH